MFLLKLFWILCCFSECFFDKKWGSCLSAPRFCWPWLDEQCRITKLFQSINNVDCQSVCSLSGDGAVIRHEGGVSLNNNNGGTQLIHNWSRNVFVDKQLWIQVHVEFERKIEQQRINVSNTNDIFLHILR